MKLLETAEEVSKNDACLIASTRSVRAIIAHLENRQSQAMEMWEDNLKVRRAINGPGHYLVGNNLGNLGAVYGELGNMKLCRRYFEECHEHQLKHHPHDIKNIVWYQINFTSYLIHTGALEESQTRIDRILTQIQSFGTEEDLRYNE